MPIFTIFIRILTAALCGGLIGLEREIHGCAAGLRTHILVCMGSTLFMITSVMISVHYGQIGEADISRIAAGVVTGIGFLGAGAIIRYGVSVRGLTTAASIWAVSAIGLAIGIGMYAAGGITTTAALAVLILSRLEGVAGWKRNAEKFTIVLEMDNNGSMTDVKNIIESYGGKIKRIASDVNKTRDNRQLVFDLKVPRSCRMEIVSEISNLPGINDVNWSTE